jgi:type II restriction enzyme
VSFLHNDVIAASNGRSKSWNGNKFTFISLANFPDLALEKEVLNTVKLIDVLWFATGTSKVIAAFEVEKSTSIYQGF